MSNYKKIEKEINLIKHNINEKVKKVDENRGNVNYEKLERDRLKEELEYEEKRKKQANEYKVNQEKMKTYNKEILSYDKNSKEEMYICSLCRLEGDMPLDYEEQQNVKKEHF